MNDRLDLSVVLRYTGCATRPGVYASKWFCHLSIQMLLYHYVSCVFFFFSSRRRHTRFDCDWSSDVCSSDLATADLHYRGFSRLYRKGGRYGPEWAAYEDVSRESPWEPIVGRYTRYGDVLPLVRAPDDMYGIIPPGAETTLTFAARPPPPLPPGRTRDFLR